MNRLNHHAPEHWNYSCNAVLCGFICMGSKQCKIATLYTTTIEILRIRRENTAWMKFMAMK